MSRIDGESLTAYVLFGLGLAIIAALLFVGMLMMHGPVL